MVRIWRKEHPCTLLVGMQIVTTIMENSIEHPQKLKIEIVTAIYDIRGGVD